MRCSGSGSRGGPGHGDAGCGSPPEAARAGIASRRALALLLAFALLTALLVLVEQQQQQHLTLWAVARGAAEEQPHVPAGGAGGEGEGGGTLLNRTQPAQFANATPEDVLVQVFEGEPAVGEDHFFFVETSCALNDKPDPFPYDSESGLRLSPRAACALASVAAAHPTRRVYLVHTCAVRRQALAWPAAPAHALAALAAPNVRLWPVRYARLYAGTPLEAWLASGALQRSLWPVVHASDALRFVLLWKYGGTYLDLDVLMLRSLEKEKNFGCAESTVDVSVGAFDFAMDEPGRRVANACITELLHYRPDLWSYNGPGAITRALKSVCNVKEISEMTGNKCGGFHLLPTSAFYAVPWQQWNLFFTEEGAEETMKIIGNNSAVHVWNALSYNATVNTSSKQPYAQIARQVCPNVVTAMGDTM